MPVSRHAVLASVLLCVSACGGDRQSHRRGRPIAGGSASPVQGRRHRLRVRCADGRRVPLVRPRRRRPSISGRRPTRAGPSPSTCRPEPGLRRHRRPDRRRTGVRVGGPAYRGDLLGNGGDLHLPLRRGLPTRVSVPAGGRRHGQPGRPQHGHRLRRVVSHRPGLRRQSVQQLQHHLHARHAPRLPRILAGPRPRHPSCPSHRRGIAASRRATAENGAPNLDEHPLCRPVDARSCCSRRWPPACYQSALPLGPPERGTIDRALVGSWSCVDPKDATNRAVVTSRPLDRHRYDDRVARGAGPRHALPRLRDAGRQGGAPERRGSRTRPGPIRGSCSSAPARSPAAGCRSPSSRRTP